jgi:hypothetical protein
MLAAIVERRVGNEFIDASNLLQQINRRRRNVSC